MDIDWYSTYLCADGGISPVIGISIRMSTNVCHLIARLSNGNQNAGCYLLGKAIQMHLGTSPLGPCNDSLVVAYCAVVVVGS